VSFIIIFGTLSFLTDWAGEVTARLAMHTGVPVDGRWRRVHARDVREWLSCNILSPPIPISSFPFPITFPWFLRFNSHSCPVTKIYSNSLPFPSPSLTNERHLSPKDQTRIKVQNANTRLSYLQNFNSESHIVTYRWIIEMQNVHKKQMIVTLQHFIGLHSHRVDRWEFWHTWTSSHSHCHCHLCSSHSHFHFWHTGWVKK